MNRYCEICGTYKDKYGICECYINGASKLEYEYDKEIESMKEKLKGVR